jgi:hypothetical protein
MDVSKAFDFLYHNAYEEKPLCLFTYEHEYPVLFFTALLKHLSESPHIVLKNVSSFLENKEQLDAEMQTTFLGQTRTLWLGSLSLLSAAEQQKMFALCASYKGPHRLIICSAAKDVPKSYVSLLTVNLDQDLTSKEKFSYIAFLYPSLTYASIQKISDGHTTFKSIDSLVILANYAMVLGRNTDAFVREWLPKIIIPESSLFTLSQYFFSKKSVQFWNAWNSIKDEYPATFWTVYWSEQIWRAYYVITMQQKNNIIDARKMAYRLPFSFIQKDWRDISLESLSKAHAMLYDIEWRIKNGGSEQHFDLLFHTFMLQSKNN